MMVLSAATQQITQAGGDLLWENFSTGQVMEFGCSEIGREDIIGFARRYDPQPFHIDEQAAKSTMLAGLAASGWHVCSLFMGMLEDGLLSQCRWARFDAIDEIKWRIPVRPGDRLRCRVTCVGLDSNGRRQGFGTCDFYCECLNGGGQTVMSWRLQLEILSDRCTGSVDTGNGPATQACVPRVTRLPGKHAITFFEDVRLGNEISLGSHTFAAESIGAFNKLYSSQPIHPNALPDRVSTNGWHVTAIWMRLLVEYYMRDAFRLRDCGHRVPQLGPSPGIKNLRWHRPVYAGDRLSFSCWADRKAAVRSRPHWGLLLSGTDVRNQRNECVVSFYAMLLLERRTKA